MHVRSIIYKGSWNVVFFVVGWGSKSALKEIDSRELRGTRDDVNEGSKCIE